MLSVLPAGAEEASTTPALRRTSRLAFGSPCRGRGGVHYAPLRRTSRLAFGSPCWGRGGIHCTRLRRTSRLAFGSPYRGRGGVHCTLSLLAVNPLSSARSTLTCVCVIRGGVCPVSGFPPAGLSLAVLTSWLVLNVFSFHRCCEGPGRLLVLIVPAVTGSSSK